MTTTRSRRKTADKEEDDGKDRRDAPLVVPEDQILSEVKQEKQAEAEGDKLILPWPPTVCCRIDGCLEDLWSAGDYHRKHRVCKTHATAEKVVLNQQEQRFCQQCSRFHTLGEFDEGKKSCRRRLAYHNERRRRQLLGSHRKTIEDVTPTKGGSTKPISFISKKVQRKKSGSKISSSPIAGKSAGEHHEKSVKPDQLLTSEDIGHLKPSESKVERNAERQSTQKKSKRLKKNDKQLNTLRSLDQDSLTDDIQEGLPNLSYFLSPTSLHQGARSTGTSNIFYPHYSSSLRDGIQLGDGIVLPPLPVKREGTIVLLQEWPGGREGVRTRVTEDGKDKQQDMKSLTKKDWQKGDWETLFHCLWDCPKVQPVWKWASRALSKIRGSKVSLEWKQAVLGEKLGAWALPEIISLWKLLRGIILGQVWHARKGKIYSGKQWTPGQIIRSTWADLMMYAMHEWLEVLKAKESSKQDEAQYLCTRFDNKWLVNGFVGRRTEWSMLWKDSYEVLLD